MDIAKINTFVEFEQYGQRIEARLQNGHDTGCEKFCWDIWLIRDTLLARMESLGIVREQLSTNDDRLLAQILQ